MTRDVHRDKAWTTGNERAYIDLLMSGKYTKQKPPEDPQVLLRTYIVSATRRRRWGTFGEVDGNKVIAYAQGFLDESV